MFMACGWPQLIPLEQGLCPSTQKIIFFKVINRILIVVSPTHFEIWSSTQHRVRLGKYKRDSTSLQREGENMQALWSPDAKLIAIITSSFFLNIFRVQFSGKRIHIGGKQPSALCLATISLLMSEQVPLLAMGLTMSNIVSDNKYMLLGLSDGTLYSISWKGELQMETLQSRLDADFLLAHMFSVKFKEWLAVLATLLRRSEVLFDLFQHDLRLWKAYSTTLQSHPPFAEYHDLLEHLQEKLASVANTEENNMEEV